MKGSRKTSILGYLASLDPFVTYLRLTKKQKSKFRWGIEILLCSSVPLLSSSLITASIAAPTKQITQIIAQVNINRPTLKLGSQGQPVSELQAALKLLGFYTGVVDGVYNETTAKAVAQFQQAAGLTANGVVDAITWQRLFPSEATVASNNTAPSSANNFPVPTQTAQNPNLAANTPQPTPTKPPQQSASNQSPKKPARPPQQSASNQPPKKPAKPPQQSASNQPPKKPAKPHQQSTSNQSQKKPVRQPSTRTQNTPKQATNRSQTFVQPTPVSQRVAGVQYTADGYPILRLGMGGSDVTKVQQRLQKLGFFKGNVDGDFGEVTEAAVIAFQKRHGLEADGVIGAATWKLLLQGL